MLYKRIKNLLDDIIDVAYAEEPEEIRLMYKGFQLYLLDKEFKSMNGRYFYADRRIELYNPSLGPKHTAKCCLHELSHHINYLRNRSTGHQNSFYMEYRRLIYASLDMGILEKEDFRDKYSRDHNKVWRMIEVYEPHPVDYHVHYPDICQVRNAYNIKQQLKWRGYHWNIYVQCWEKEVEDRDEERKFLNSIHVKDEDIRFMEQGMKVEGTVVFLTVKGNTFACKDALKAEGFYWDAGKRVWRKKVNADRKEIKEFIHKFYERPEFRSLEIKIGK